MDTVKTLKEWSRVLKKGGILATILPDERKLNTIKLDSIYKHVFTPESYNSFLELIGGYEIIKTEEVVPNWSFISVAKNTMN
ncbi:MAG: hypothetical protein JW927_11680 [Deltaproteobacteria bacterium]|nr:hypothetical protein [Deltaproteobacteria bacterium]